MSSEGYTNQVKLRSEILDYKNHLLKKEFLIDFLHESKSILKIGAPGHNTLQQIIAKYEAILEQSINKNKDHILTYYGNHGRKLSDYIYISNLEIHL
jgi:hypothetical protein